MQQLLKWTQNKTAFHKVKISNLTTSWKDGLAFCALLSVLGFESEINFDQLDRNDAQGKRNCGYDRALLGLSSPKNSRL